MESLQLAQMLADLSSLNATEPNAAAALVTANKVIETVEKAGTNPAAAGLPKRPTDELRRAHSSQTSRPGTGTASPARVDKFGRRIMMSPPVLSRSNSAQGSVPGTPKRDSEVRSATQLLLQQQVQFGTGQTAYMTVAEQGEDDLDRASTLMALYEIRAKLKQQDNSSLMKAREKIADLAARQQQQQTAPGKKEPERLTSRFTFPK
ncbi:uncharacterized protein ColSpa_02262 [Colletotrichum spaethianum]|uniref:Uncharacterized protein n=1 Tax=Colletotrichum spaethianum TaxID=700344 RepID=A0AA37P4U4_9PEZI|nr:uncharacterized protein ColSpa_02262 [Colletotrichum spaethianum]GKT42081.1 hypothetical protein ColSpa_02262 [Colletotrichum spaethianum]